MGTGKLSTHPLFSGEVPDSPENEQILTPGVQHFKGQSSFLDPGTLFYTNRKQELRQPMVSKCVLHPFKHL